ncbi:hypothetical protein PZB74_05005 [Porifericola rhodea]|uniref:hypothetical protein n=1 Tax=Porifericola rhodea TaxID=930972 RepID=UPI0026656403|nr:hypothetical protein [Porifericola rhodea]WKN32702.1 hypothetical protein PZB74_05005 [Porifericola rhodea]
MKDTDKLKKNVFEAPEGYFEGLQGRIARRIAEDEKEESPTTFSITRWTYAVAASVLVLLVASLFLFKPTEETNNMASTTDVDQLLASVSDEDMLSYLESHTETATLAMSLTEAEQQELLLNELDNYNIPLEDYEYEIEFVEEYL